MTYVHCWQYYWESQDELGLSPFRPIFSICISDLILWYIKHFIVLTERCSGSKNLQEVGNGGKTSYVCVSWSHLIIPRYLQRFLTTKFCFRDSPLFASLTSCSLWDRAKLIAPLSFAQAAMEGFPIIPVWSCVLSILLPTIPRISPCKSLRGRSKAKQQEIDHRGFLHHSFKYWCT